MKKPHRLTYLLLLLVLALSACQGGASTPVMPEATSTSAPAPTETPTPTIVPTKTASPTPDPFHKGGALLSGTGNKKVTLKFINHTDQLLTINWMNFTGVEEPFTKVSAGSTISQDTYSTHAWRVRDESNKVVAEIVATNQREQVFEFGPDMQVAFQPTPFPPPTMGPDVPVTERAYADRPDDYPGMYQIHVLYIIPSDAKDRQVDTDGSLARSVEAVNQWFSEQTGGTKVRFDTYKGQLDVTFVKLDMTNAEFYANTVESYGSADFIRDYLESTLDSMHILHPGKIYTTVFDINKVSNSCADGPHPPDLVGRVTGHYPVSTNVSDGSSCSSENFGFGDNFADMGIIHEIVHALGYASSCSKNHASSDNISHTGDDVRDLMWAPAPGYSGPWWDADHMILDPGNDDYYKISASNCPDLANSIFLDPLPASPQLPANWPDAWILP